MTKMLVYRGTTQIASITADARTAFRSACLYVRALAHADGVQGDELIEAPRGRVSVSRGWYRAVTEGRVRL